MPQHDGSVLRLRKLHADYDPTDRLAAMNHMQLHQARGEVVTGLLYVDPEATDLHAALNTVRQAAQRARTSPSCARARRRWRRSTHRCAEAGSPEGVLRLPKDLP